MSNIKKTVKEYGIYYFIMLFSLLVRIVPISSGSQRIDAILNELSIGAMASALVALLIYHEDKKRLERKNEILRAIMLKPVLESITWYMEQYCFRSSFMPPSERSVQRTFLEWVELYCTKCDKHNQNPESDFLPIDNEEWTSIIEEVEESASSIINNEIWLTKEGVISRSDIKMIKSITDGLGIQFRLLGCSGPYATQNLIHINQEFAKELELFQDFKGVVKVPYSYDLRLSRYINPLDNIEP